MDPESRTTPATVPDESIPGGCRGKDDAEPLGEPRERAGGDVAVVGGGDQLADAADLVGRQPVRRGLRAGGPVLELAGLLRAPPGVVAGRRESDHAEEPLERHGFPRAVEGPHEAALGVRVRDASAREVEAEGAHERDEHAQDRGAAPEAAPQAGDLRPQVGLRPLGVLKRDHAPTRGPEPTRRRGPRDAGARGDRDVARSPDELAESVVVGPARAGRCHPGIFDSARRSINPTPGRADLVGWRVRGDDDPSQLSRRS